MNQFGLHALPKVTARGKKRVGRGYGSGKGGHTSGRGQKGQKSRRTIPWSFEGGALPLSQRLPFWRGKGRLNPLKPKPVIVNIGQLERLDDETTVDLALLVKERVVHESEADARGVKILGDGKLTKKLTVVGLQMSQSARAAIEKAGGTVSERAERKEEEQERKTPAAKVKIVASRPRSTSKKETSRKKTSAGQTKRTVLKKKRLAQKTKKR